MSKIEYGKLQILETDFKISEALADSLKMLEPQICEKNHKMKIDTSEIIHEEVVGDCGRIRQVFVNLLSNAVKYTPDGGHITVIGREKKSSGSKIATYEFEFQDDGIGMSEEFSRRIFEPFEREEDLRVSKIQGTGLGLAITKNIVRLMGGTIDVDSEYGKGSCFTVVFPLKLGEPKNEKAADAGQCQQGPDDEPKEKINVLERHDYSHRRILIVEDNELNREIMVEIIGITHIQIETAEDGARAVELFEKSTEGYYDMILMDIQMPHMNGYKATKAIRSIHRGDASLPIVAMTANAFEEDIHEVLQAGMDEHMAKPVEMNRLEEVLIRWLGE
ncbi:ATP-binding protein [Eisenbergiella sp.]